MAAPSRQSFGSFLTKYFLIFLFGFGIVTIWMNSRHVSIINPMELFQNQHFSVSTLATQHEQQESDAGEPGLEYPEPELKAPPVEKVEHRQVESVKTRENAKGKLIADTQTKEIMDVAKEQGHKLAGLDCTKFGGPSNDVASEMVYWSDIPSDNAHVSPFYDANKYMTFEPDEGGWNNIRMNMETVLAMAVATGRTLVLPPVQGMYLLNKAEHDTKKRRQRRHFSFNDFYHLESIAVEHGGLNIITMKQFLEEQAMTGKLKDASGNIVFPPGNLTDWNGLERGDGEPLNTYLRTVSYWPQWDPETCLASFPASKDPKDLQALKDLKAKIETGGWDEKYKSWNAFEMYVGKPNPVDAPAEERAKENWAQRTTLCIYDDEIQEAPLIHFGVEYLRDDDEGVKGARLLVQFYEFLFFQDWKQDLWTKRFVRDHVRYVDMIQCAAARVVNAVRERARDSIPSSNGEYDAFHIRRGDFQYKKTRVDADKIYEASKDALTPNATIYIGTDERDKSFFKPVADHYDLVYLDDFKDLVSDVNSNFYGMLDQLITSRARVFFGCWYSTFTGHITRIRGYHSVNSKLPGYEDGALPNTYYYVPEDKKLQMQTFFPVKKNFWEREFPTAWRDIDKSIGEMTTVS